MQKRSVAAVVLLPFVTFGIYSLYWVVTTKGELNRQGANIPTAWLLLIPLVNLWWLFKYFEGAEQVTNGKVNGILMLVLGIFITPIISYAICQSAYNDLANMGAGMPGAQPMPAQPAAAMPADPGQQPPVQPQA